MAKHTLELDDLELTALITHLEGQSEMMVESRLNCSNPSKLPDNQVVDECVNYWDDHFEDVVEEIKEYVDCKFKKPIEERFNK